MNILTSTKNISQTYDGTAITIRLNGVDEYWIATYEEDDQHNMMFDHPIKIVHCLSGAKDSWKSYKEFNLTTEIVDLLDKITTMFQNAPDETKKVLL